MKHWNGKEQPMFYRPHSNLLCSRVPDDNTLAFQLPDLNASVVMLLTTNVEECRDHPGRHEGDSYYDV